MAAEDADNPGGETLPSSVQPLYVSPLIPDAVVATLSWEPVAGASSYHVYRSSEPRAPPPSPLSPVSRKILARPLSAARCRAVAPPSSVASLCASLPRSPGMES